MIMGLYIVNRDSPYIDFEALENKGVTDIFTMMGTWQTIYEDFNVFKTNLELTINAIKDTNLKLWVDIDPLVKEDHTAPKLDPVNPSYYLDLLCERSEQLYSEYNLEGMSFDDYFYPPALNNQSWSTVPSQINAMVNFAEQTANAIHTGNSKSKLALGTSCCEKCQIRLAQLAPVVDLIMPETYRGYTWCIGDDNSSIFLKNTIKKNRELTKGYKYAPVLRTYEGEGYPDVRLRTKKDLETQIKQALFFGADGYVLFCYDSIVGPTQQYLTSDFKFVKSCTKLSCK